MTLRRGALIGLCTIAVAQAAAAQTVSVAVDVSRLGIDLVKIQRDLRMTEARETSHDVLKIHYTIDVYGQAPRIDFFTRADNLQTGPVPYGAPTHREMLQQVTPIEFRAPIMDFSALVRWLVDRANKN